MTYHSQAILIKNKLIFFLIINSSIKLDFYKVMKNKIQ